MVAIKADALSAALRDRSIRPETRELLISRIAGTAQERDLSEHPNCQGYGRVRHFHIDAQPPWPANPLPVFPAAARLQISYADAKTAQVFQNAACNWRCWYCYVPFELLKADEGRSAWLTAERLIELYLTETTRPLIIDCSGGQPDLVPEWTPWMMDALTAHQLQDRVYLWSDDNLSNDYFWRFLKPRQIEQVATFRLYGRVGCFKGFDATSFAFNTKAAPELFDRQFAIFARLCQLDLDLYAYATFTTPHDHGLNSAMVEFVDRLQTIHHYLPLRVVPLRIETFGVVRPRIGPDQARALDLQDVAIRVWNEELNRRFSLAERSMPINEVSLRR